MANCFPPIPASQGVFTCADREDDYPDSDDFKPLSSPVEKPAIRRKATRKPRNNQPTNNRRASKPSLDNAQSSTMAQAEHVDLTRSDDDRDSPSPVSRDQGNLSSQETNIEATSADVDPVLDVTTLPNTHETKFLRQARLQFLSHKPPFVRQSRKEGPRMVTLAVKDGQLSQTAVLATLVTREWDSKFSYYTLDCNGERLIVKPIGGKVEHGNCVGCPYRTWSGQGNVFEVAPIAFGFKGDTEEQPSNGNDNGYDLESTFEEISIQRSSSREDEDYSSTISGEPDLESEAPQGSDYHGPRTRSALSEPPAPHASFLPPNLSALETSTAVPKISEVAAGKRPASDTIDHNHSLKRLRPATFNSSSTAARIPRSLTSYKQEHTILYVLLPGRTSEMVPIKLRSAMTISTLFSSVSAAAGVIDYEHMAIAVVLEGEDGSHDKTIIVRRNMVDTFEVFLEIVDAATCWEDEGGMMTLQLQLRWPFEMDLKL